MYRRERIYIVIQNDSHRFADVIAGHFLPCLSTLGVHGHRNLCVSAVLRELSTCVSYDVTLEAWATVRLCLECDQLEVRTGRIRFNGPAETYVTRQDSTSSLRSEHSAHLSGIYIVYTTYNRTTYGLTGSGDIRVENTEERVLLLVLSTQLSIVGLRSYRISGHALYQCGQLGVLFCCRSSLSLRLFCFHLFYCFLLRSRSCELTVDLHQLRHQLSSLVGLPELQVSGTLEELTNTLRLFHTRKLDQDTARLCQLLDVRLNNTKTVDTVTEHVERVLNSCIYFLTQHFLNVLVGSIQFLICQFFLQCETENRRQLYTLAANLFVRLSEQGYKVVTTGFLFLTSRSHRLQIDRIGAVAAQSVQDVRYRNLHGNVHTTLEVQTQVDFFLTALLERVTPQPYFLGCNRVVVNALRGFISYCVLFGLTVMVVRHKRERQIKGAYHYKAHRQNSNKSFVLHNLFLFNLV